MTNRLAALALVGTLACRTGPRSIAPEGLADIPYDTVRGWVAEYTPQRARRYDLRWQFLNDRGSTGGRAAIRIAPPDSLRFDFRGAFGRSGAAVVIGDSGIWARPEGDFEDLLRTAPLFWAALGLPLPPERGTPLLGLRRDDRRAWRYVIGRDTFDFIDLRGSQPRLLAEMRRRGTIMGMVDARLSGPGGVVTEARLDFPAAETRFSFKVERVDSTERFGPDTWQRP